jgi:hypothetical protein
MKKKIKIGIILLIVGIAIVSGWRILSDQPSGNQLIQQEKTICSDFSFEMNVGDEEGPPANTEEQKRLCENRLRNTAKYKDFDRGCKFIKASSLVEEEFKSDNFVSEWKWICYFDCCVQNKEYCEKDSNCHWVCGCGCINKNAECEVPEGLMHDCYPIMEEDYSCVCKNNQCETIEK